MFQFHVHFEFECSSKKGFLKSNKEKFKDQTPLESSHNSTPQFKNRPNMISKYYRIKSFASINDNELAGTCTYLLDFGELSYP